MTDSLVGFTLLIFLTYAFAVLLAVSVVPALRELARAARAAAAWSRKLAARHRRARGTDTTS